MTRHAYDCRVRGDHVVEIQRQNGVEEMDISFKRTVRVPDNCDHSKLPPDLGNFPLFKTKDYGHALPASMVAKGGLSMPMHSREAMWINFSGSTPFAVKVYVGSVNAVSGEAAAETENAKLDRLAHSSEKEKVQDYVVVPHQQWLDGVTCDSGFVQQFVAMDLGNGYTVEAQVTGQEARGGLQFEITPVNLGYLFSVQVKRLGGETTELPIGAHSTVADVKRLIALKEGIPAFDQRLIYAGRQLEDSQLVLELTEGDETATFHLVLRMRGGGGPRPNNCREMGIAVGGFIEQGIVHDPYPAAAWNTAATVVFNVQILNASTFEAVTGILAPETPITMETYSNLGLPFFELPEEKSGISGRFDLISVGEHDGLNEESFPVPIHVLGNFQPRKSTGIPKGSKASSDDDIANPAGPLQKFRHVSELVKEVEDLSVDASD
ncbi:hypothetical protein LTR47_001715 [Exophiala xenobiotica]|nr:hypothetical protein LTR92_000369 [Exophiala xenobiotica]KAK5210996.1 hypothetical protein LTR41_003608 [Exophiala xenobiotica]KAK5237449.1 hypothetical protein LTR47_001715 [Exophiala xenobiotica]KAK5284058.1 hypothetical protein LTR40_000822 [Exophiala xenobiotica]KAK5331911.1 hypothetical protein LTR93_000916 [Exophiala xenobiotica]